MLTPEQIKNLKPGDHIVIHAKFKRFDCDGDLWYSCTTMAGEASIRYVHPKSVSLPSKHGSSVPPPKHDPCRLFKKGDKVKRKKEINGRLVICAEIERIYIVTEDEDSYGIVRLDDEPSLDTCHYELELVTPVEELEPYGVTDNLYGCIVFKDNPGNVVANFNNTHPHAKEAAEAERDRLNEEWRKEQNNG